MAQQEALQIMSMYIPPVQPLQGGTNQPQPQGTQGSSVGGPRIPWGMLLGLGGFALGGAQAQAAGNARAGALKKANQIVDTETGMLNAVDADQYAKQQAMMQEMQQRAAASQAAFQNEAMLRLLQTSQLAGIPNPNAGQLSPYPKGDNSKVNAGADHLSG